jgi:hypothetical protein
MPGRGNQFCARVAELMTPILGAKVCSNLIDDVMELQYVKDVRDLRPMLERQA